MSFSGKIKRLFDHLVQCQHVTYFAQLRPHPTAFPAES